METPKTSCCSGGMPISRKNGRSSLSLPVLMSTPAVAFTSASLSEP